MTRSTLNQYLPGIMGSGDMTFKIKSMAAQHIVKVVIIRESSHPLRQAPMCLQTLPYCLSHPAIPSDGTYPPRVLETRDFMCTAETFARIGKVSTTRKSFHCVISCLSGVILPESQKFPRHGQVSSPQDGPGNGQNPTFSQGFLTI